MRKENADPARKTTLAQLEASDAARKAEKARRAVDPRASGSARKYGGFF